MKSQGDRVRRNYRKIGTLPGNSHVRFLEDGAEVTPSCYSTVHTTRAVLRNIPKKDQQEVADLLREAYGNEQRLQDCADDLDARGYQKAAATIERLLPGLLNYTAFLKAHRKRIRTTNVMERINRELKRRTRVVGAFPSDQSLLRLAGSILRNINEEWITGKRYLLMDE